jgi:hypothetical protein
MLGLGWLLLQACVLLVLLDLAAQPAIIWLARMPVVDVLKGGIHSAALMCHLPFAQVMCTGQINSWSRRN